MEVVAERKDRSCLRVLRVETQTLREFLAELLGTFLLTFFSIAAGAQRKLNGRLDDVTVPLANGIGVAMAIYSSGAVSGGYVNPALSLAMSLAGRLPWRRFPVHVIAQMIGAFVAACTVFGVYNESFDQYDGGTRFVMGPNETASLFSTFPKEFLSLQNGFFDSALSTGLFILCVIAIMDKSNMAPSSGLTPLAVGLLVFLILSTLGSNVGGAINPARDLGPRLFMLLAGYGTEVFSYRDYKWFWVPILAPMVGSAIFTLIYWIFIAHHWPRKDYVTEMNLKVDENGDDVVNKNKMATYTNGSFQTDNNVDLTKF